MSFLAVTCFAKRKFSTTGTLGFGQLFRTRQRQLAEHSKHTHTDKKEGNNLENHLKAKPSIGGAFFYTRYGVIYDLRAKPRNE